MDMLPLLDAILEYIPAPDVDPNGPVAMQICTVDHSDYVGRIGTGRLFSGSIDEGDAGARASRTTAPSRYETSRQAALHLRGPRPRRGAESAEAGDIIAVTGVEDADIGDVVTDVENPVEMEPDRGRGADALGHVRGVHEPARRQGRRHRRRPPAQGAPDARGRGQHLHAHRGASPTRAASRSPAAASCTCPCLMETMRREGYEFQVGRPRVLFKEESTARSSSRSRTPTVETPERVCGQDHRAVRHGRRRDGQHGRRTRTRRCRRLQDSDARHHGPAHQGPKRQPRRGHLQPSLQRVRPVQRRASAGARTAPWSPCIHGQGGRLRARHAPAARHDVRRAW